MARQTRSIQLNVFRAPAEPEPKRTYDTLDIHAKINYRANLGSAFHSIPYVNRMYRMHTHIRESQVDSLRSKYWLEYYANAGSRNRRAMRSKSPTANRLFT